MLPAVVVNGVGAVADPVPPVAAVYHNRLVPVADNADAIAFKQYTTGVVTVGAATPICNKTGCALIKSTIVAVGDGDVLVLIKIVFTPKLVHGSIIALKRAVRSMAASTNRFALYVEPPNAENGGENGAEIVPALVAAKTEFAGIADVLST